MPTGFEETYQQLKNGRKIQNIIDSGSTVGLTINGDTMFNWGKLPSIASDKIGSYQVESGQRHYAVAQAYLPTLNQLTQRIDQLVVKADSWNYLHHMKTNTSELVLRRYLTGGAVKPGYTISFVDYAKGYHQDASIMFAKYGGAEQLRYITNHKNPLLPEMVHVHIDTHKVYKPRK